MPVGVPYVEYLLPESEEPEYINLYNALYRERMLFLCQALEDTIANELIGLMLYLNGEDPEKALFLYINSPGGSVTCGIGMYDIMRYLNSGITTICMGTAASMASFILAGGTRGRRFALPNSRIMIHQPEGGSDGQASEIISESVEVARIRRQIGLIYANRTQQSIERIAQDLDRDQFMSASEARAYGIIDAVAIPEKSTETPFDLESFKEIMKNLTTPIDFDSLKKQARLKEIDQKLRTSLPVIFDSPDKELSPSKASNLGTDIDVVDDVKPGSLPLIVFGDAKVKKKLSALRLEAQTAYKQDATLQSKGAFTVDVDAADLDSTLSRVPFSGQLSPTPNFASKFASVAFEQNGKPDRSVYKTPVSAAADEPDDLQSDDVGDTVNSPVQV